MGYVWLGIRFLRQIQICNNNLAPNCENIIKIKCRFSLYNNLGTVVYKHIWFFIIYWSIYIRNFAKS